MIEIRAASLEDADAIAELHVAAWRWAYRDQLPEEFLAKLSVDERRAQWESTLAASEPAAGTFVAERGGRIVGFTNFGPTTDADGSDGTGEVHSIYLDEAVVGTGVGRQLFERAHVALRDAGFTRATLWVLESNARTRRFYEKAGWSWDGTTSSHDFECGNLPIVRYAADL